MDVRKEHHRRALYYRDNTVNDLFILNSPNSYYTGVVEISGAEIKVIMSCISSLADYVSSNIYCVTGTRIC